MTAPAVAAEATAPSAVSAAVRPGWAPATSQAAFVRAVEALADEQQVRCDGRRNLLAIAWVYARRTDWRPETSMVSSPSRALVMQLTGLSDATVKRWTCWMVRHGVMAQLEVGRLAQFRPMAVQAEGGRVSVYVICARPAAPVALVEDVSPAAVETEPVSSVDKSDPSVFLLLDLKKNPYASARANRPGPVAIGLVDEQKRSDRQESGRWPRTAVADSRTDRLTLVEALQAVAPALRPASTRALRSELRPWLERSELGWDVRWLLHALDHTPDGQAHPFTADVRVPPRWLRHRMSLWLDEQGRPLPSPGVQQAAARSAQRAETAAVHDERRARSRQSEDEPTACGDLVRDVAGPRYPALVEAVLTRHAGAAARLMPARAAEAVTRAAVREIAGPDPSRAAVEAAVENLLHADT